MVLAALLQTLQARVQRLESEITLKDPNEKIYEQYEEVIFHNLGRFKMPREVLNSQFSETRRLCQEFVDAHLKLNIVFEKHSTVRNPRAWLFNCTDEISDGMANGIFALKYDLIDNTEHIYKRWRVPGPGGKDRKCIVYLFVERHYKIFITVDPYGKLIALKVQSHADFVREQQPVIWSNYKDHGPTTCVYLDVNGGYLIKDGYKCIDIMMSCPWESLLALVGEQYSSRECKYEEGVDISKMSS
jgi:hypothetical protein